MTWSKVGESNLTNLQFITEDLAYGMNRDAELYKTTDGGMNWVKIWATDNEEPLYNFHFLNKDKGFNLIGSKGIQKTENGGLSWEPVNIVNEDATALNIYGNIAFINEDIGIVVGLKSDNRGDLAGNSLLFLCTLDGGDTWTSETIFDLSGTLMSKLANTSNAFFANPIGNKLYRLSFDFDKAFIKVLEPCYLSANQVELKALVYNPSDCPAEISCFVGEVRDKSFQVKAKSLDTVSLTINNLLVDFEYSYYFQGTNCNGESLSPIRYFTTFEKLNQFILSIYPNPIKDWLYFGYEKQLAELNLKIFNSQGKLIFEPGNLSKLDFRNVPIGIYFLSMEYHDQVYSLRFLKE